MKERVNSGAKQRCIYEWKAARNLHSAEVTFATNDSHFVGYANRSCDAMASAREENVNFKTRDSIRPS